MKLDKQTIGYINVFERHTGILVKDCFSDDGKLIFIVNEGSIGKAIGKGGSNVRSLSKALKKAIKVFEFNDDIVEFVKNLIYPVKVDVEKIDNKVLIKTTDNKTKGYLFGRDRSKLKGIQKIVNRYFDVEVCIE